MDVLYLALHQHGDVYKHIVQLLDATFQTDDVFVSGFDFTQGLFRDPRVHNLCRGDNRHTHTKKNITSHLSLNEEISWDSLEK